MAFAIIPLMGTIGIAIDAGRLYMVQTRLKTATDAAVLVAAGDTGNSATVTNATSLFWANFQRQAANSANGFLGTNVTAVTVTNVSSDVVAVHAEGALQTTFMNLFGIHSVQVSSTSQATRAATGMELALVLDNTGSMKGWPIQSVVTATSNLVDVVYGSGPEDTHPNLWVSVVPFTAEVNIGANHTGWLQAGSYNTDAYMNGAWKGCRHASIPRTQSPA